MHVLMNLPRLDWNQWNRKQGVLGDPVDQRHQVHHVAQRLVPVRDHPEEMVGSLSLLACPCMLQLAAAGLAFCQYLAIKSWMRGHSTCCCEMPACACSGLQIQVVSIVTYVGSLLGIVLMYVWYAPSPSCKLNILFITVTLVLVQLMTFVSMSSKASNTHTSIHALKMGLGNVV